MIERYRENKTVSLLNWKVRKFKYYITKLYNINKLLYKLHQTEG